MAIEVFNRYEHKYMLDRETYLRVLDKMEEHMVADAHNVGRKPYTIANLYFDTPDDYLIRESLSKPKYKEKLRLRAYGVPQENDKVYLEIKKKYNGIVNKRRTTLRLQEAYAFAETGIAPAYQEYMNRQVIQEIAYFLKRYEVSPKLYLAYDRIAYFEKDNADLRISFDSNIRSRRYDLKPENGDYGVPLLDENQYLMEVKTSLAKPMWLVELLTELGIRRNSFSKYGTEYKNRMRYPDAEEEYKTAI